jgi:hypothetical protein
MNIKKHRSIPLTCTGLVLVGIGFVFIGATDSQANHCTRRSMECNQCTGPGIPSGCKPQGVGGIDYIEDMGMGNTNLPSEMNCGKIYHNIGTTPCANNTLVQCFVRALPCLH